MNGTGQAGLVRVVQDLSHAEDVATIQDIVRRAARELTGADGATFVLREGDQCFYADEDAIAPLWKGLRFPLTACISGWAMLHRHAVAIEDIYADDRIPHDAYRPTFVKSLAMVPIRSSDPLGAIGNYWAEPHNPSPEEVELLQALADSTAVAMARAQVLANLERLVAERTAALAAEVEERRRAEEEVRKLSLTDELTGLANRRGFLIRAEQARAMMRRRGVSGLLLFVDIDHLKEVNDSLGHTRGDQHIREAAALLVATLREGDVIGRWGGDEFVAFLPEFGAPRVVAERIQEAVGVANRAWLAGPLSLSLGMTVVDAADPRPLGELVADADVEMYRDKQTRRAPTAVG